VIVNVCVPKQRSGVSEGFVDIGGVGEIVIFHSKDLDRERLKGIRDGSTVTISYWLDKKRVGTYNPASPNAAPFR